MPAESRLTIWACAAAFQLPNDDEVLARVYDAPLAAGPSLADELNAVAKLKAQFKPPDTEGVYTEPVYALVGKTVLAELGRAAGSRPKR